MLRSLAVSYPFRGSKRAGRRELRAFVLRDLYEALGAEATREHRTLTAQLEVALAERYRLEGDDETRASEAS